ncbi:hypothetical protein QD46_09150 [Paenibacillus polymyxa]|nr:hypothetical protein QD46_09150 [Paenibacillus polymyxa]
MPVAQGFVMSPTARAASVARMDCGQCRPFAEPSDCFSALHDKRVLLKRAFFMSQKQLGGGDRIVLKKAIAFAFILGF